MGKNEIEIKSSLNLAQAAGYLRDLAACLEQGRVVLQRGDEFMELCPAQNLELELEGAAKKGRQKISLELSWRLGQVEPSAQLKISAEAPTPPPVEEAAPEAPVTPAAAGETPVIVEAPAESLAKTETPDDEEKKAGRGGRK